MIKEANVTVVVSDLNRAVKFYTEMLGLKIKNLIENEWAEVQAPGLTIGLHPAGEHGWQDGKQGSMSIGFVVEDIEQEMTELKKKGISFSPDIVENNIVKLVFFVDPDKNPLYLCQIMMEKD